MAPRLAALLWDVDGTLAETELDGHRRAFNHAFAAAGLPWRWDADTYCRLLAVSGGRERLGVYLQEVEGQAPAAGLLEHLVALKQTHYSELVSRGELALRPGVASLIAEAAAAGLPQGIVTTSSRRAVTALARGVLGELAGAFSFWICGEDVPAKKPDPSAYRLGLERLGLQGAAQVLAIEDSGNGLAAAGAAGLPCLVSLSRASAREPRSAFARATAVVESLAVDDGAVRVLQGPPCAAGQVTLSWLEWLLAIA
ncbi:MAG: HAD-IA family hydrolase [Synechococcaceae cyanobacterium]|nr:HAD-IA family hydrolase [Synechococcaceae cyanobacterium]